MRYYHPSCTNTTYLLRPYDIELYLKKRKYDTSIMKLGGVLMFFFLILQSGLAASGKDSVLQAIQSTAPDKKLEAWKDWQFGASEQDLLDIWEHAGLVLDDAKEVLEEEEANKWYISYLGRLMIGLQAAGQGGASTQILDEVKNFVDSLSIKAGDVNTYQADYYYYLAYFNYKQVDMEEAETLFKKSLSIYRELADAAAQYKVLNMLGLLTTFIEEHEAALGYYAEANAIAEEAEISDMQKIGLNKNMAYLYQAVKQHQKADSLYAIVVDSIHLLYKETMRWRARMDYAANMAYLGRTDQSLAILDELRPELEAEDDYNMLLVMAESYSDVYFLAGNYQEATKWLSDSRSYYYSVQEARRKDEVQEWQAKYQSAEKEAKINALEQEKTIGQSRTIIGTLVGIGFIGLLAFFLYANRNRRKRLALQLENEREIHNTRSKFFASIAHDIRTPLSLMLAPLERLESSPLGESDKADVRLARRNGTRLMDLFNQILDWNKADAKMLNHNPQLGNIELVFSGLGERFRDLADRKDVRFDTMIDLPAGDFLLDYGKLERVVSNLLENAFKYCSAGDEVKLRARLRDETDTSTLEVEVIDNGPGIAKADQQHIFTRYYQGEQGKLKGGNGIGLALVKELVQIMNGELILQSAPGEGASFTVKLPISPASETVRAAETLDAGDDDEKPSILIVEDEPELSAFIASELARKFEVFTANTVANGLAIAKEKIPDVIITDWRLPDGNGGEMCRRSIDDELTAHIPIIVLTAFNTDEHRREALDAGAIIWMTKPFQLSDLNRQLDAVLQHQQRIRAKWDTITPEPDDPVDPFITKLNQVILKNYDDEDFSMDRMAEELTVSRVQLFRKVKKTIGNTPGRLLNEFRLQKARQLLRTSVTSVSDACFQVGFSDPGYFTKLYKQRFGLLPSEEVKAA